MKNNIIISGALANTYGKVNTHDLVNFLAEGTDDWDVYVLRPRPGSIMAAALDWQAILGTTADLIQVGGLLYAAYQLFIKPIHDKDRNSRSFLYIVIKHIDGRFAQFSLGTEKLNREDFIELFRQVVNELRSSSEEEENNSSAVLEIEESDIWKRIKKK